MASHPTVNVPPAELLKSFIERAFKSPFAQHPMLAALKAPLDAAVAKIDALLGGAEKGTAYDLAKANARDADARFDEANRFAVLLLEALAAHRDTSLRTAATYLSSLLFPDRLAVIQLSFELEAASGATFAKRLAQPQAQAAVVALTAEVPQLATYLQAIVSASVALGQALEAFDAVLVDKAGKPVDPALFATRTEAHRLFAAFAEVVETFAYPSDGAEDVQARTALLGPYRRFLSTNITRAETEPTPEPAPTP